MKKTLVITGGSRGIGRATALQFVNAGYEVFTTSTSIYKNGVVKGLNYHFLDLSWSRSIELFVDYIRRRKVYIDVLINNAAIGEVRGSYQISRESLRHILEINLVGTIDLTENLLPYIKKKGIIINISSEFGSFGDDWGKVVPAYKISKAGINMYTKTLAKRLENGIKVFSFDPGWVKTDMGGKQANREPIEPAKELLKLSKSHKKTGNFYRGMKKRCW